MTAILIIPSGESKVNSLFRQSLLLFSKHENVLSTIHRLLRYKYINFSRYTVTIILVS